MSTRDAAAIRAGIVNRRRELFDPFAMMLWFIDARKVYSRRRFRLYSRAFDRAGNRR